MRLLAPALFSFVVGLATLTACSGTSSPATSVVPATPSPTPTPVSLPTVAPQTPFAVSTSVPETSLLTYASDGGYRAQLNLGTATIAPGTQATLGLQDTSPQSAAPFARIRAADVTASDVLVYLSFLSSNSVTAASTLSVTIPPGVAPSASTYWLSLYDPLRPSLGFQFGFSGPGSVNGSTVTFTMPSYVYEAGQQYWYALYVLPMSAASPTPAPSISPLPTPSPTSTPSPTPSPTAGGVVIISTGGR